MKELLKSNDHILISYIKSLLDDSGIDNWVFDRQANSIFTGMLDSPMRLMVKDEEYLKAKDILENSGAKV